MNLNTNGTMPPITTTSSTITLVDHFHPVAAPPMPTAPEAEMAPSAATAPSTANANVESATMWTERLSASFGAIAQQITGVSQALAAVEVPTSFGGNGSSMSSSANDIATTIAELFARVDGIGRAQERLSEELEAVRAQLQRAHGKDRDQNGITVVEEEARVHGDTGETHSDGLAGVVEELQKKVDEILETIRLDQARLYARLQNATISTNKGAVKPLVMANGKTPANFPGTKGEFEHLTKERYEHLLKSYSQPIKGDTAAKRESVREFLGLPPAI